jgi:hypothetical protein
LILKKIIVERYEAIFPTIKLIKLLKMKDYFKKKNKLFLNIFLKTDVTTESTQDSGKEKLLNFGNS